MQELCGGIMGNQDDPNTIYLEGHIKNSQTRALFAILETLTLAKPDLSYKVEYIVDTGNHTAGRPDKSSDPDYNLENKDAQG